jgi:hypothetical protein
LPRLVWQSEKQPDPGSPAIFYSPHQDDETLGMGASIAEQVRSGRAVYIVLLSNGANDYLLSIIRTYYNPNATMQDCINARNNEFIAACIAMGVHRIYISNNGAGYSESSVSTMTNQFQSVMNYFAVHYPDASHRTISGNLDSYNHSCSKMPTHQAAATALHLLQHNGNISDASWYRIYIYYWAYGSCDPAPSRWRSVNINDKLTRINALQEYKKIDPPNQRYGLGYASVAALFNNSWYSDFEYLDLISNNPGNLIKSYAEDLKD